ncbi:tandem-95 repeat protein, partial [Roseimaritima sediminicola]|uniref:tandem-95 repeat protein n=1 Tax=Roseimaritima sediminicola TaxID=2662066 RepID=UPI0012983976
MSVLSGTAFEDSDGNGQRAGDEAGLERVVVYLDQNDNGVLDRLGLEPDLYPAGQTVGHAIGEATVRTTLRGDAPALATSANALFTSTGSRVFANQYGDVGFSNAEHQLEIDVTGTVDALSIDFTAIEASAVGQLMVFDDNGNLLTTVTTGSLAAGQSETLVASVPGIAYAIAASTDSLRGTLDNLTLGQNNEPTAITDSNGQYTFTNLPAGDYVVREIVPSGYDLTAPQASAGRLFAIDPNITNPARIIEIDPGDGTTIRSFDAPGDVVGSTAGLAFDGNTLFFIDASEDRLYELNPDTGGVLDLMVLDSTPRWDGVAVLDGLVYVNAPGQNKIYVIDPVLDVVQNIVSVPSSNYEPFGGLGELPDASGGKLIGPVGNSNVVALLDPSTGEATSWFSHAFVNDGRDFGVTSMDGLVYLGFDDPAGTVQVYEPDGTPVRSFQTGFDMSGLGAADSLDAAHRVTVGDGETISDLDFGNIRQTGSIRGVLFEDENGNGQRDADEDPLAGITVYLDTNNNRVLDGGELSTQTGADGSYQFNNLPIGDYMVRQVVPEDFVQTAPGLSDAFFYAVAGQANELITIDAATGEVAHVGLFGTDMNGLVHTRSGELFGLKGTGTDGFYSIDTTTGAATLIGPTGDVVFGLAYDPATDTIYTVRNLGSTRHLAAIDRSTGALTTIGPGSGDVVNVSGIAFDAANNQVIAFDNLDAEFWGFDVQTGAVTRLSDTSDFAAYGFTPVGDEFVMSTTQGNLVQIDPFTATATPYLTMSEILGIDALDYVPASDGAQYVTVSADAVRDQVNFGNQRRGLTLSFADTAINENGGTTTATVTRNTDLSEELVVYLSSGDTSEASVPATVTIPAGESEATFIVSGVDDSIRDGSQTVYISAAMSPPSSETYSDDFSAEQLGTFWTTITDIPGSSVTQTGGVLRVESPSPSESFLDTGVRSQLTFGHSDFTAQVDFRHPQGSAMSWMSVPAGPAAVYGIYHYPNTRQYLVWVNNAGSGRPYRGRDEFGDESTNWHQLKIQYDAATQTARAFVDGTELNTATVDLRGGPIKLFMKDSSWLGEGLSVTEFDNFSLTYDTTVGRTSAPLVVLDDESLVAEDDTATTAEDTAVTIDVLANDGAGDSTNLTVTLNTPPTNGSATVNSDGSIAYTPKANFYGADTFTYQIADDAGATDTATVTITVTAVNDAPVAVNDAATTDEDTAVTIDVLSNDSDVDEDALGVTIETAPANGSVVINNDRTITYTPDANFNGQDTFVYAAVDPSGKTDPAVVTVTVSPVNDAPTALDDAFVTDRDVPLSIGTEQNASVVDQQSLAHDHVILITNYDLQQKVRAGVDGQLDAVEVYLGRDLTGDVELTLELYRGAPWQSGQPDFTTQVTPASSMADGWLRIDTSAADFALTSGELFTLGLSATRSTTSQRLYLGMSREPLSNDSYDHGELWSDGTKHESAGVGFDLTFKTHMRTVPPQAGVLANDSDPENDPLTAVLVTSPSNGTLSLNTNGGFTYTPNPDFAGTDQFTYRASDGQANSNVATATITVRAVNRAPDAVDDRQSLAEDTSVTLDLLANDFDPDGDPITLLGATEPANGTVDINADGTVTYTPNPDFSGIDLFYYTISDDNGYGDSAQVTMTVTAVNDAPAADDDTATTDEDTAVTIDVLANDSDVDKDTLTVSQLTQPANGSAVVNNGGAIVYTPNANFHGIDTFTYTTSDGAGGTATATVTVTVNPVNDAPAADDDTATTDEDTAVTIDVLANDSDVDDDTLTVSQVTQPANGSAVVNNDGAIVYTPSANFHGIDTFTYTISDGAGGTDTATVTVTVNPVNDAPVADDDTATTDEDTAVTINVLANDSDVDGDTLTVSQ